MKKLKLNLQLFADNGDNAGTVATGEAAEGVAQNQNNAQASPNANAEGGVQQPEDRGALWAKYKAEFKDEYDSEVQGLIKDRVKSLKSENARYSKQLKSAFSIISPIASNYGIDPGDIDAVANAYRNDRERIEAEAYKRNMSPEAYDAYQKMEAENQALKDAAEERRRADEEQAKEERIKRWEAEAEDVKKVYNDFDVEAEVSDERFRNLVASGVPMQTAYEVLHLDDIVSGSMQFAVQKAAKKVANSVAANMSRPTENGAKKSAPATMTKKMNDYSLEDFEDMNRRHKAGERFDFER